MEVGSGLIDVGSAVDIDVSAGFRDREPDGLRVRVHRHDVLSPSAGPELELSTVIVLGPDGSVDELRQRSEAGRPFDLHEDLLGMLWSNVSRDTECKRLSLEVVASDQGSVDRSPEVRPVELASEQFDGVFQSVLNVDKVVESVVNVLLDRVDGSPPLVRRRVDVDRVGDAGDPCSDSGQLGFEGGDGLGEAVSSACFERADFSSKLGLGVADGFSAVAASSSRSNLSKLLSESCYSVDQLEVLGIESLNGDT